MTVAVRALGVVIAGAAALADPVLAAEPWEGSWSESAEPRTCTSERGDGLPLIVMSTKVARGLYVQVGPDGIDAEPKGEEGQILFQREADPWVCYIGKVTNVRDMNAWIFDLECGGEGEIWRDRAIIIQTENPVGLAAFNLISRDRVFQLFRCE